MLDEEGDRYWANPRELEPGPLGGDLTAEQVDRIKAFRAILREHTPPSLEVALEDFRRDVAPDREVAIWERVAQVYAEELEDRPEADAQERGLLYRVLLMCSMSGRAEDVVSSVPGAKALPGLDRVIARYNGSA